MGFAAAASLCGCAATSIARSLEAAAVLLYQWRRIETADHGWGTVVVPGRDCDSCGSSPAAVDGAAVCFQDVLECWRVSRFSRHCCFFFSIFVNIGMCIKFRNLLKTELDDARIKLNYR